MADCEDYLNQDLVPSPGFEDLAQLEDWLLWESSPDQLFSEGFKPDGLPCGGDCSKDTELAKDTSICPDLWGGYEGLCANLTSSACSNNSSDVDRHEINLPYGEDPQVLDTDRDSKKSEARDSAEMIPGSAAKIRNHGAGENLEPKRQLRLVKNREAAYQSRQRKKSYIQSLESKCRMWENYCNQLQQSIAFTCAENTVLRNELTRCKRQKGGKVVSEPAVLKDSPPLEFPSHLTTPVATGHTGGRCLGWLVAVLILLHLGEPAKPSGARPMNQTENEDNPWSFRVIFLNVDLKIQVLEAFPVRRVRALSSCHHHCWRLKVSSLSLSIPRENDFTKCWIESVLSIIVGVIQRVRSVDSRAVENEI